jgi:hypothetical protein
VRTPLQGPNPSPYAKSILKGETALQELNAYDRSDGRINVPKKRRIEVDPNSWAPIEAV